MAEVKSLKEIREEQIQQSAAQQQRRLQTQEIAQTGKTRREASRIAQRRDLPGYGRGFDVRVAGQRKEVEKKIGEAFKAQAKEIRAAAKRAIRESAGVTGLEQEVVVLPNEEYVNKEWFDTLKPEEQDEIRAKGLKGEDYTHFMRFGPDESLIPASVYKEFVLVGANKDEWVSKGWYEGLKSEEQDEIRVKGLKGADYTYFMRFGPDESLISKSSAVAVGVDKDELVSKEWYDGLKTEEQSEIMAKGLKDTGYQLFETVGATKELIPKRVVEGLISPEYAEWLSTQEYLSTGKQPSVDEVTIRYRDKFRELGAAGYNSWLDGKMADFGYVKFTPLREYGEYVPQKYVEAYNRGLGWRYPSSPQEVLMSGALGGSKLDPYAGGGDPALSKIFLETRDKSQGWRAYQEQQAKVKVIPVAETTEVWGVSTTQKPKTYTRLASNRLPSTTSSIRSIRR